MKPVDPTTFKAPFRLNRAGGPCLASDLKQFEQTHKLKLPGDFRSFLELHDGGDPQPDCFTKGELGIVVKRFFSCAELETFYLSGVVEFGSSPFGDRYAISCRFMDYGSVYFI